MPLGGRMPLLVLMVVVFGWMSRLSSSQGEAPAFSVFTPPSFQVSVRTGDLDLGVYQKIDDLPTSIVNRLTNGVSNFKIIERIRTLNGRQLTFDSSGELTSWDWMPASQRMSLQIPLHPDRMKQADWMALPGIGPSLSAAIETDRQENGDFGTITHLVRVKGIGPKRLKAIESFFQ